MKVEIRTISKVYIYTWQENLKRPVADFPAILQSVISLKTISSKPISAYNSISKKPVFIVFKLEKDKTLAWRKTFLTFQICSTINAVLVK